MTATSPIEMFVAPDRFFRIVDVERFADGSGFVGRISLRCGSFALHDHKFFFDNLDEFLSHARELYQSLSGKAQLRQLWERNHLSLNAASRLR